MEESLREALPADAWRENFAQTIDQQRRRAGERIAGQRERLRDLDARIAAQLDGATQELASEQEQARQATSQSQTQAATLQERQNLLEDRKRQLDQRQTDLDQLQAELAGKTAAETERLKDLKRREAELAAARQAHADELQNLKSQLDSLHQLENAQRQLESNLKLKEQTLQAREQQTKRQRQSLGKQLRARKSELAAEAELIRAQAVASGSGQDLELQLRLSELQGKYDHLREELESHASQRDDATERLADLKAQLASRQQQQTDLEAQRQALQADLEQHRDESRRQAEAAQADLARHASELDSVRRESHEQIERLRSDYSQSQENHVQLLKQQLAELRTRLAESEATSERTQRNLEQQLASATRQSDGDNSAASVAMATLRDENKQLEAWLAEAEEKAKNTGSGGGQEMDDLRRRFEMAVQDVRELKTKNVELSEQLSKARQSAGPISAGAVSAGSWESLKQKLLADLETDFDDGNSSHRADKLTVQGAIKITDEVVAEKDRELVDLRRLLDSQTQQVGEIAVGAAAVAQMLDTDELICQERDALKRLQDSLRDQLRQAEVDISVERAKLARERAEVDEKIRAIEDDKANTPAAGGEPSEKGKKPSGRKWLARLGLGDGKDE